MIIPSPSRQDSVAPHAAGPAAAADYTVTVAAAPYKWQVDAFACYGVAIAALREKGVREGRYEPQDEREREWQRQGPVPVSRLDAGRIPT